MSLLGQDFFPQANYSQAPDVSLLTLVINWCPFWLCCLSLLLEVHPLLSTSSYFLRSGNVSNCTVWRREAVCYCRSSSCLRLKKEMERPGGEVCVSVFFAALTSLPWMSMAFLIPMSKRERTVCWCKTWLAWVDDLICILF